MSRHVLRFEIEVDLELPQEFNGVLSEDGALANFVEAAKESFVIDPNSGRAEFEAEQVRDGLWKCLQHARGQLSSYATNSPETRRKLIDNCELGMYPYTSKLTIVPVANGSE